MTAHSPTAARTAPPHDWGGATPWPVKDPYGTGLWAHQRSALRRSIGKAAFYFAHSPGLGKTATVIAEAGAMFLDGDIDTLIIVAPNRVHRQWVMKQFPLWAGYPHVCWLWPSGGLSSMRKTRAFEAALDVKKVKPRLRVFAFNIEAVRLGAGRNPRLPQAMKLIRRIVETSERGVYVALDEAQRAKDPSAQQTRGMLALGRGVAKVRRALSGSPILQGVHDLWSQYAFLDPLIIGHPRFWDFRLEYCKLAPVPGRPTATRIVGGKNEKRLMERIAPFTSRVLDTEILDLPPQVWSTFEVEMDTDAQRLAYAQMEGLMLAGLKEANKVVTASIVLTQLQKLQQVGCGFILDEDHHAHWLSTGKVEAIATVVEDLNRPTVVWAPFIALLDKLTEVIRARGIPATRLLSLDDLDVWSKAGGALIANPAVGSTGIDGIQHISNYALYAANTFSLEHRIQSIKRLHRSGQSHHVFYTDFITAGSKDSVILDALNAKQNIGTSTIDQLRKILL